MAASTPPPAPTSVAAKQAGTLAFSSGDFTLALSHYKESLSLSDPLPPLPLISNIILCHYNLRNYTEAAAISSAVIHTLPSPYSSHCTGAHAIVSPHSTALSSLSISDPPTLSVLNKIVYNHLRSTLALSTLTDDGLKLAVTLANKDSSKASQEIAKQCIEQKKSETSSSFRLKEALNELTEPDADLNIALSKISALINKDTQHGITAALREFMPTLTTATATPLLPPLYVILKSLLQLPNTTANPLAPLLHPLVISQPLNQPDPNPVLPYITVLPLLPQHQSAAFAIDLLPHLTIPATTSLLKSILVTTIHTKDTEKDPEAAMSQRQANHAAQLELSTANITAAHLLLPPLLSSQLTTISPASTAAMLSVLIDVCTNYETTTVPSINDRESNLCEFLCGVMGIEYEKDASVQEVYTDPKLFIQLCILAHGAILVNDVVGESMLTLLLASIPSHLPALEKTIITTLSSCCKTVTGRGLVKSLVEAGVMKDLMRSEDVGVSATAVAIMAKVGFKDMEVTDEKEMMQAGLVLLEEPDSAERGIEILSYLTNKTAFKNVIASSSTALTSILSAAPSSSFGVASILSALTVSIEQQRKDAFRDKEITEEQYKELQKMAMEKSTSEQDELDPIEAVSTRIMAVVDAGGLLTLKDIIVKAEYTSSSKTVAMEACMQIATERGVRGAMIQAGVLKAAIELLKEDCEEKLAAHARFCIAKMLVTTNPIMLSDAQCMGSIPPLLHLVQEHTSTNLQQFEGLLSLTNLGGANAATKSHIIASKGVKIISYQVYSEHELVRRAAVECVANLLPHEKTCEYFTVANNFKIWSAYARDYEAQFETSRAAAGGLAMAVSDWDVKLTVLELLEEGTEWVLDLIESANLELMHRGVVFVKNLMINNEVEGAPEDVPEKYKNLKKRIEEAVKGTKLHDTITVLALKGDEMCRTEVEEGGLGDGGEQVILLCKQIIYLK